MRLRIRPCFRRRSAIGPAIGGLGLLLAALAAPAAWAQAPIPFNIQLTLSDPDSGETRYTGIQRVREEAGVVSSHTEYRDLEGETVQTVDTRFDKATLTPLHYEREDPASGYVERYSLEGNDLTLVHRERKGAPEQRDDVEWIAGWISSVGIPSYIRRNWTEVEAGVELSFPLFVPGRKTAYRFKVQRDDQSPHAQEGRLVVRMEADTFVVRQFVDALWFVFETQGPRELMLFEGRSSLPDAEGGAQRLRVQFAYKAVE